MFMFHAKQDSYIGVDIGSSGVKISEVLNQKGRARLLTYGWSEYEDSVSLLDRPDDAASLIARVWKESGAKTTKAVAALQMQSVFSVIVTVPAVKDEKALKPMIEAQIRKLIPSPLEDLVIDSKILDEKGAGEQQGQKPSETEKGQASPNKNIRVLVTGAPRKIVSAYVDIFKKAKLELVALETETFALVRSLVGKDKSSILIIDIGSQRTNMAVVEKGVPFVERNAKIGGDDFTSAIAGKLSISTKDAAQIKKDFSVSDDKSALRPMLEQVFKPLINEIQYTFDIYSTDSNVEKKRVDKIILTGGSSHIPALADFISELFHLNVYVGDPWARVVYPPDLRPALDAIGPKFAVSVGLAMRDIDS
ncbi:MAG: hypothetical protein ACD_76C00101G0005 [uncultured bacterium]|nr:MAG: hypothetical protein ACD_76C00101G0005 [uncultured bacterium]HBD05684.1 hypothetical protein [Candidatus Uhrbacteria bacterium]